MEDLPDLTRSFANASGGLLGARKLLESYKKTMKPFLDKHPEYIEDYSLTVGEINTILNYSIKKIDGPKEDRGDI